MKIRVLNKDNGFSLVEILVSTLILVVVSTIAYQSYVGGSNMMQDKQAQTMVQTRGLVAMSIMTDDLRQATQNSNQTPSPNIVLAASPNNSNMNFYLPMVSAGNAIDTVTQEIDWNTNNMIQYKYIADPTAAGKMLLQRVETGTGNKKTIARSVSDIRFTSISLNELRIDLTITERMPTNRTISKTFTGLVKLRNRYE